MERMLFYPLNDDTTETNTNSVRRKRHKSHQNLQNGTKPTINAKHTKTETQAHNRE